MATLFLRVSRTHRNKDEYLVTIGCSLNSDTGLSTMPPILRRSEVCKRLIDNCILEELNRLEDFLSGKAWQITTTVSEESANKIQPNWRE